MRMNTRLDIYDIGIEVTFKKIRNIHLRICPPDGRVQVSAPMRTTLAEIRDFATSKLAWIRKHRTSIVAEPRAPKKEFLDGDSLSLWGRPLTLGIEETRGRPRAQLEGDFLVLRVGPGTDIEGREKLVDFFYKEALRETVLPLLELWQARLGVRASALSIRRMKSKWGSCFPARERIGLNSELAKKSPQLLEYVLVHELVHLFEANHGPRFKSLMDRYLPNWKELRDKLNHPERQG